MFDELRELYQEVILDHSRNPRNLRQPADGNRQALCNNPLRGAVLTVVAPFSSSHHRNPWILDQRWSAIASHTRTAGYCNWPLSLERME
jgi:hypothetical protein